MTKKFETLNLGFYDIDDMTSTMKFFNSKSETLNDGLFQGLLKSINLPNMQLTYDERNLGTKTQGSVLKDWLSFVVFSSDTPIVYRGVQCSPSCMLIIEDVDDIDYLSPSASKTFVLTINKKLFYKAYTQHFGEDFEHADSKQLNLTADTSSFKFKIITLIDFFLSNKELNISNHEMKDIELEMINELLSIIEGSSFASPSLSSNDLAHQLYKMIIKNIQSDTTISQMCKEMQCSERTAYKAFKNLYGITPNQLLIHLRLSHIHRNLKTTDPIDGSVKNIAKEYAFFHMGYLSQVYKRKFQVSPSTTLHQNRLQVNSFT